MEVQKAIERIAKEISDWQNKLQGYEKELEAVNRKLPALEEKRDGYILPARAEGDQRAQVKLDTANAEVEKLHREQHELSVLVEQVRKKISELKEQKKGYERQADIFKLNAQRDKRAELAKQIEEHVNKLLPLLAEFKNLGREMYSQAKTLGVGHGSILAENRLASFLHGRLGSVLPSDFQSTLSRRVPNLTKTDLESVDAVMEARGLRVASDTEGKAVANG